MTNQKVLFLVPYSLQTAPSQRFRVESFLPELRQAGIEYRIESFFDRATGRILYKEGHFFLKLLGMCKGFMKRWWTLFFVVPSCNYVFIHREASPIGPPVFEWIITKIFRKRVIYDFDDAIWIPNKSSANYFANLFKACWKTKYICKWAYKVVGGNDYLCTYARKFNKNVIRIPTSIDTDKYHPRLRLSPVQELNVGWTGSHSTLKYLDQIIPVIRELQKSSNFKFIVIADKNPSLTLNNWQFVHWTVDSEVEDLLRFDIGVMPLTVDKWSEGKCGFKLIQYFACGLPSVASPVGVNNVIVDECNGFLCTSYEEWKTSLQKLLADGSLRERMGAAGRTKVIDQYSIQSQIREFIHLFS